MAYSCELLYNTTFQSPIQNVFNSRSFATQDLSCHGIFCLLMLMSPAIILASVRKLRLALLERHRVCNTPRQSRPPVALSAHSCWGGSYFILCYSFWQVPGQTAWANRTVHNGPAARHTVQFHCSFPWESSSRSALLPYCSLTPDASASHTQRQTITECRLWLSAGLPVQHASSHLLWDVQDKLYWSPENIFLREGGLG